MKIIITGATGFVGAHLVEHFKKFNYDIIKLTRSLMPGIFEPPYLDSKSSVCRNIFGGTQIVIHCAGLAHRLIDDKTASWSEYKRINVDATLRLAKLAASNNVRRFIFLSSAKVCGENTNNAKPFTEADPPNPCSYYALSKHLAEIGLLEIGKSTPMDIVIIRPPLVYGRGVKANFKNLMTWIRRGNPLPFSRLDTNRRSFIGIDNLSDFISNCVLHPNAANQIFFVSDACSISTAELIRRIGSVFGIKARLFPVPVTILTLVAKILSKDYAFKALSSSLEVDISKSKELLGWEPPIDIDVGLKNIYLDMN